MLLKIQIQIADFYLFYSKLIFTHVTPTHQPPIQPSHPTAPHPPCHPSPLPRYGVDCRNSNTGLFCGLLVVVAALVSIILFFVFVAREEEFLQLVAVQVKCSV